MYVYLKLESRGRVLDLALLISEVLAVPVPAVGLALGIVSLGVSRCLFSSMIEMNGK